MAKRRPRPHTYDSNGADLGAMDGFWDNVPDPTGESAGLDTVTWFPSSDPDLMQAVVPNGTAFPADGSVIGTRIDVPSAGLTTWYAATTAAILRGRVQAATDTAIATGEKLATAGGAVLNAGAAIAGNLMPILLGIAAIYVFSQWDKFK